MTLQGRLRKHESYLSPTDDSLVTFLDIDVSGDPLVFPVKLADIDEDGVHFLSDKEVAQAVVNIVDLRGAEIVVPEGSERLSLYTEEEAVVITGKPFKIKKKEEK